MRWNPFMNALYAAGYVWGVGLLAYYTASTRSNTPDTFIDPIAVLSLLVFSAALMGFLFFYRPVVLLVEHKRDEAVSYFLKTLGTFGAITILVIVLLAVL